jgi:tRNA(adenine34) deaminase
MRAGACRDARIGAVAFGAVDGTAGALGSGMDRGGGAFGREIPVYGGFYEEACARLLTDFFKGKR